MSIGNLAAAESTTSEPATKKKRPIGLELYSVRGELAKDLPNTLKAVAKMGYEVVEFYSPYFKWKPPYAKEVRTQMDDLGLRCYSTHNGFESFSSPEGLAHAIELNQILGLGAGYHNHQAEWAKLENGQRILEVIAANTPKQFVLQLDVGTCEEAGADPVAWVKANPGRIKVMHMKDWTPGGQGDGKGYRVLFGEGITKWKELVAAAESVGGIEYYLIEQEGSRLSEFDTAKKCLESWKAMFEKA
jgi:sugar phosphate isomerase/epimerase